MKNILTITIISFLIISCEDIINTDPNYERELIYKVYSPEDSLRGLEFGRIDLGKVKVRSVINRNLPVKNISDSLGIEIYEFDNTNKSGLFTYSAENGLPVILSPGEDIKATGEIRMKLVASTFEFRTYYDTVYFNGNKGFFVPIEAKIGY
jgi:hypothetical protein